MTSDTSTSRHKLVGCSCVEADASRLLYTRTTNLSVTTTFSVVIHPLFVRLIKVHTPIVYSVTDGVILFLHVTSAI